jgi:hypothetical protein
MAAAVVAAHAALLQAQGQFQPPPNALELNETGKLEAMQGNFLKFRDEKENVWLVQVLPQTTVSIEGEADSDYLRPGLVVELTGEVKEDLSLAEPIKEIDVLSAKGRPAIGLFAPDSDPADAKPLREPEVGKYRIRGRVTGAKEGTLSLAAGRFKITGKLDEDVKVRLKLDNAADAQFGDAMTVKAWYYDDGKANPMRAGKAVAEDVKITLSNPPSGKK